MFVSASFMILPRAFRTHRAGMKRTQSCMTTSLPPLFTKYLTRCEWWPIRLKVCRSDMDLIAPKKPCNQSLYVWLTFRHCSLVTQGRASTTSFTEHRVPKVDFSAPLAPEMASTGKPLNRGSFVVTAAMVRLLSCRDSLLRTLAKPPFDCISMRPKPAT